MTDAKTTSPWLMVPRPNPRAALRLFCFPYAGGAAHIFRGWPDGVPHAVEVCAVQYPGRGSRLAERPFTDLHQLVRAFVQPLLPLLDRPFAFFGHSMGAAIGFELAHLLREEHGLEPAHLFVSGRRAPQLPRTALNTYLLPDDELLAELRQLNGTPGEVLDNPELMQLLLPILRADFELIQTYTYAPKSPLGCPLTAFGGLRDDEARREQLEAWREHTTARFSLLMFPGDHFFLHDVQTFLLEALSRELNRVLTRIGQG